MSKLEVGKAIVGGLIGVAVGATTAFVVDPVVADVKHSGERCQAFVEKLAALPDIVDLAARMKGKSDLDNAIYALGDLKLLPELLKSYSYYGESFRKFNESLAKGGAPSCSHTCVREAASSVREACSRDFASPRSLWRRLGFTSATL